MARPNTQEQRRAALIEVAQQAIVENGLRPLSLTDVAKRAGLTRGAVLYYFADLDALLEEVHAAAIRRFNEERRKQASHFDDPREQLAVCIRAGLPSGRDDDLMRLLYDFDILAGHSARHDEIVEELYLAQLDAYRGVLEAGIADGSFVPTMPVDDLAMTLVALEDAYSLHIVGGNRRITVADAERAMFAVAARLGCVPRAPQDALGG